MLTLVTTDEHDDGYEWVRIHDGLWKKVIPGPGDLCLYVGWEDVGYRPWLIGGWPRETIAEGCLSLQLVVAMVEGEGLVRRWHVTCDS